MKLLSVASFPRAILHLDADAFFASVEQAKDPSLKGKPVVVGAERGIAAAFSYEAKALGITRAMPIYEVRRKFPQAIIVNGDYDSYSLYSARMFDIVRRYSYVVDEYSLDECFARLQAPAGAANGGQADLEYERIIRAIQGDVTRELDISVSIGVSLTKTLAKVGSKHSKPHGLVMIPGRRIHEILAKTPVGKVWGIGQSTTAFLNAQGIQTAYDFVMRDERWIKENLSKPFYETWQELNGQMVFKLSEEKKEKQKSISKTRTFTPPSSDRNFIFAQLSKNIENACIKARRFNLASSKIFIFLKTQEFKYIGTEFTMTQPSNIPQTILELAEPVFNKLLCRQGLTSGKGGGESLATKYRATGVVFADLHELATTQTDLFGGHVKVKKLEEVYASIDELSSRYGKHAVFLGSTMAALSKSDVERLGVRRSTSKVFSIPVLGTVS